MQTTFEPVDLVHQPELAIPIARLVFAAFNPDELARKPAEELAATYMNHLPGGCAHYLLRDNSSQRVLGLLVVKPGLELQSLHILRVAVEPEMQGRGYGRALVRHAAELAIAGGRTELDLFTRKQLYFATFGFEPEKPGSPFMWAEAAAVHALTED